LQRKRGTCRRNTERDNHLRPPTRANGFAYLEASAAGFRSGGHLGATNRYHFRMPPADLTPALDRDGFYLLRGAFSPADCDRLLAEWEAACATDANGVMRSAAGAVYGARNILDLWPNALALLRQPALADAVREVLGPDFGLVRILYFDKPPGESWALPWHKDLAVAVKDNRLPSAEFERPTTKYGVPHVEAPAWLLDRMLTARLHLDEVTEENGPLRVLPGSHRDGKDSTGSANEVRVLCDRGDVLLMRPLLSHCSGHSHAETTRHRRILHLEFSGVRDLPDGYEWHTFIPAAGPATRTATSGAAGPLRTAG
jgi:hypothetical protein